jgi:cell division protein ZapA
MDAELSQLEERLAQLVQRLKALREETATCASSSPRAPTRTRARREARAAQDAHRGAAQADSGDRIVSADGARDKGALTINLLGREFRVGCPEGEEKQLLASVDYLNRKLKEVRDYGKVVGNERIAIMAALNIAHECLSTARRRRPVDTRRSA